MGEQINDCLSVSRWANLNTLFVRYRTLRDDASRDALEVAAYEAYSYEYLQRRFSSLPTTWVEEIGIRLCEKIDDAIDDPTVIDANFNGYVSWWLRSIKNSVKAKRSREVAGLPSAPDGDDMTIDEGGDLYNPTTDNCETRDCDRKTAATNVEEEEKRVFMRVLWAEAFNIKGLRGQIFRLYMVGLMARANRTSDDEFKYKGIARKLSLNPQTVASHIRRTKLALRKSFLSLAHVRGIIE